MNYEKTRWGKVALVGLIVLLAGLAIYWPPAKYPLDYHNDEPGKVAQLLAGERNFRHPLLMLEISDRFARAFGALGRSDNPQLIAEIGRWLSGFYMAAAAGTLAAALSLPLGIWIGLATGAIALCNPAFFEASQYFKEDALHLFTLGSLALWVSIWSASAKPGRILFPIGLGLILGLALSARYYAAALIPPLLIWAFFMSGRSIRSTVTALVVALVTVLAIHLPWLMHGAPAQQEIAKELFYFQQGHYGVGIDAPHMLYLGQMRRDINWPHWLVLIVGVGAAVFRRDRIYFGTLALALAYIGAISCSPKFSERYLLPIALAAVAGAAYGLHALTVLWRRPSLKRYAGIGVAAALTLWIAVESGMMAWERRLAFEKDDRVELSRWINEQLPQTARIAQDGQAMLESRVNGRVIESDVFIVDRGSLSDFRARGITHIILSRDINHRYTDLGEGFERELDQESATRRERYRELLVTGRRLWSSKCLNPKPMHPGLDLIEITEIDNADTVAERNP